MAQVLPQKDLGQLLGQGLSRNLGAFDKKNL